MLKTFKNNEKKKKKKHNKTILIARSKLNSIETKTFKTLKDNEISHEEFTTTINEAENYFGKC